MIHDDRARRAFAPAPGAGLAILAPSQLQEQEPGTIGEGAAGLRG